MVYAFARAFSVSALVVKKEHLLPVHRPKDETKEVEVGVVEGGVRARVVERQIVRHLTHLIPYLSPSLVTTLIHPFFRHAFLQPDPLTLHATHPRLAFRLAHLFIVLLVFSLLATPARSPFLSTAPPPCYRLESFRLPTPYKRSCCPFITTTPATTTTERPTAFSHFHPALPFHPSFSIVSSLLSVFYHLRRRAPYTFVSSFCSRALPRSLLTL